jgi:hemerythrin
MNEQLEWQDDWLLGIDDLDDEHREMVRLINRLLDEEENTPILQRASDLVVHLRAHFSHEELFLRRINYPGYCEHKHEHKMEMAEVVVLLKKMKNDQNPVLDPFFGQNIKYWFLNHAVLEDKRFAAYFFQECNGVLDEDATVPAEPPCFQSDED